MKKGFSVTIFEGEVVVNSFISKEYDNLYLKSANFDFLFEGVLLNKQKLLNDFALKDFETLIKELYLSKGSRIIDYFEGEFRGFIYNKDENKFVAFTNISSTQRIFGTKANQAVYIDTSLVRLNAILKEAGVLTKPDLESLYQLLCFSNILEEKTPIENIKKLLDGHYFDVDCKHLYFNEIQYFNLAETPLFIGSKKAAIDQMDQVFSAAITLEYKKDSELKTDHLALLSGGLDSRVAMMYALKNNFKPGNALCFSQSNYYDHTISKKIAVDQDIHYEFIPLDAGKFLEKIDHLTEISEGLVSFTGGIHVQHAVENMAYENFALFHSGQIGDGVLGAFNTEPRRKKPSFYKIVNDQNFLPQVRESLEKTLQNYETEEAFLLRNIAFNRTVLGAHVLQQKRYQTSPFMDKQFLQFALSLPEEWKYNHRFYLEWINKHCKEATHYRWERTLMKPDAQWKTTFGDKVLKRGFNLLNNKILRTPQNGSMYPYQYYFDQNLSIQQCYDRYFNENLNRLEGYPELYKEIILLFRSDRFFSKTKAINILSIFKLYF